MGEFKVEGLRLSDFSGPGQVLHQGHKLMVVPTVIVELDLSDELDLDSLVLQPLVRVLEREAHLPGDRLSVVEEEILLFLPVLGLVLGPLPTLRIVQQDLYLHALPEPEEAHVGTEPAAAALAAGPSGKRPSGKARLARAPAPRPRGDGQAR